MHLSLQIVHQVIFWRKLLIMAQSPLVLCVQTTLGIRLHMLQTLKDATESVLMPARRYVEEIGSAAILAPTVVTPEVNLRECITHMPLSSTNNAAHSGFETQRRHHQKSKTGVSVAPQKGLQFFFKKFF